MAIIQDPHLTAALIDILHSPACMAINFTWINQRINSSGYQAIAQALTDDRIGTASAVLANGALAGYVAANTAKPLGNIFYFSPHFVALDPLSRVAAVHESTHAVQDATMAGSRIFTEDEEGAAYFAQSLFNIFSPSRLQYPQTRMTRPVWRVASSAAQNFASNPPNDRKVSDDAIDDIVNALKSDPQIMAEIQGMNFVDEDDIPASP
jgi:hypothetical protein